MPPWTTPPAADAARPARALARVGLRVCRRARRADLRRHGLDLRASRARASRAATSSSPHREPRAPNPYPSRVPPPCSQERALRPDDASVLPWSIRSGTCFIDVRLIVEMPGARHRAFIDAIPSSSPRGPLGPTSRSSSGRGKFACLSCSPRPCPGDRPIAMSSSRRPSRPMPVSSAPFPRASKPRVRAAKTSASMSPPTRPVPPSTPTASARPFRSRDVPVRSACVGAAPTVAVAARKEKGRTRWPLAP